MKITSSTSSTSTSGVMLICACSCRIDWSSNPMSHLPFRPRWPPRYARSREGGTHKKTPPRRAAFKGKPGRRAAGAPAPVERLLLDEADLLHRSEEHTSELQSLMRTSYAVFCLKKQKNTMLI